MNKFSNFNKLILGLCLVFSSVSFAEELKLSKYSEEQGKAYDAYFEKNHDRHINKVKELVAFPTLAMVPENAPDLKKAGDYLVKELEAIGMKNAKYHPAEGFPWVTAEWMEADGQPTILFYGHFDIQPVDKTRWDSDPYKAEIRDNKLYGRGATDDKGYIIAFISTLEAILKTDGKLPVNVKVMFDGAEEFGSQSMQAWLQEKDINAWVKEADYGFSLDAMMQSDDQGLMWRGLRGGGDVEVTITSANTALHSGIYGGAAPNASHAAAKIIASFFNDDGSVAIKGFYDDLTVPTQALRDEIAAANNDMAATLDLKAFEIDQWVGEQNYTPLERTWIRNSLDITGLKGGYIEGKASTIAYSTWFRAMARTGPGQDPEKLNQLIMDHIKANTPWGVKVEMVSGTYGNAPFFSEDDHGFKIGHAVLTDFFGKEPKVLFVGGGVPALAYLPAAGGPLLTTFSFQRSDEGFHADNEYMRIDSFKKGQRAYAQLLHALIDQPLRD
jgi:acetylornithine deacetylase/succinyl-diaminopimelate desuccinylase-like protein